MERRSKSDIIRELTNHLNERKDWSVRSKLPKSEKIVVISMTFEDIDTFTDAEGVVWVKKYD